MKRVLTKLAVFLTALCLVVSMFGLNAFAAGTTLTFNKSSLNVGDKLTATLCFSADEAMYSFEAYLRYDSTLLRFDSGDSSILSSPGEVHIVATPGGSKSIAADVTFTALAAGSSTVAAYGVQYVGIELQRVDGASGLVEVYNPNASSNADLKSLVISSGNLEPAFSPSITTYNVIIPYETTILTVSAVTDDPNAKTTVFGDSEMKVGINKRVILVTAPSGTVKSYTLNITRLLEDGSYGIAGTTDLTLNKTNVSVGDKLTVTVHCTTDEPMYAFEAYLQYDSAILRYEQAESSGSTNSVDPGEVIIVGAPGGDSSIMVDVIFTVLATGSSSMVINNAHYVGEFLYQTEGCSSIFTVDGYDLGDVNGDRMIDIRDLVRLNKVLSNSDQAIGISDINLDGQVNTDDFIILRKMILFN